MKFLTLFFIGAVFVACFSVVIIEAFGGDTQRERLDEALNRVGDKVLSLGERIKVCDMRECTSNDADRPMWPPSCLQYSMSGKSWVLPQSASEYNMGASVPIGVPGPGGRWTSSGNVPASASLYSMSSGSSSISGVSSVSSTSASSNGSSTSSNLGKSSKIGSSFRRSQLQSIKMRLQEYQDPIQPAPEEDESSRENRERRLPPIKEFQRDFKAGKASTRLRCAQKIVTQLESAPSPRSSHHHHHHVHPQQQVFPSTSGLPSARASSVSSKSSLAASCSSGPSGASTAIGAADPLSSKGSKARSASSATSSSAAGGAPASKTTPKKLTAAQEVQRSKKERAREKEREKAEKARLKELEKAEKARQKEAKKLAKEEKKRAKKEAKARRKESERAQLLQK